jgi:hypothetical protein
MEEVFKMYAMSDGEAITTTLTTRMKKLKPPACLPLRMTTREWLKMW